MPVNRADADIAILSGAGALTMLSVFAFWRKNDGKPVFD